MTLSEAEAKQRGPRAPLLVFLQRSQALPVVRLSAVLLLVLLALMLLKGPVAAGQTTLNGLVSAGYYALGAVGLTLVFGVLRLVNFAHGDLLTFGAYVTIAAVSAGMPFWAAASFAVIVTALLAVALDFAVWAPLRRKRTNTLQLFLVAIGLALILRYSVQFFGGGQIRSIGLDTLSSLQIGPWRLGTLQFAAMIVGLAIIVLVGLALRFTRTGKQLRALSDNMVLAEITGIDTIRAIRLTWAVAGGLAALAGILYAAAIGSINPNFGITILLSLFAAAILGGIGNAYGALAGGIVIGLSEEWATLFFNPRWKPAVGFVILILTLLIMPRGIFGRGRNRL
jgi:branched-subunit amino acid ABC-type transport system permease component